MSYQPKIGDRVRVVYEGDVTNADRIGFSIQSGAECVPVLYTDEATVEKIEPPTVTFKPGSVVREKDRPEKIYLIDTHGWVTVGDGWSVPGTRMPRDSRADGFTNDEFELVSLG